MKPILFPPFPNSSRLRSKICAFEGAIIGSTSRSTAYENTLTTTNHDKTNHPHLGLTIEQDNDCHVRPAGLYLYSYRHSDNYHRQPAASNHGNHLLPDAR